MEYTNVITPLALIASCIFIGAVLGGLYFYYKFKDEILNLEMDLDDAVTRLNTTVPEKFVKAEYTRLDNNIKAQLQIKDDTIDRINALRDQDLKIIDGLTKNLETAASQILILENRISKNKKVAVSREKELKDALVQIDEQLSTIAELETDNIDTKVKSKDSDTEIGELTTAVTKRDHKIERLEKRIQELEIQVKDLPVENETGFYKRMKKIQ